MAEQCYANVKDDYYEMLRNPLDIKCLIPCATPKLFSTLHQWIDYISTVFLQACFPFIYKKENKS